jgi:hypothetical protein
LALTFILRVPSFFEPFSYGDEMIYLTLGQGIRKGLILYKDIHDNKPPLIYFLANLTGNIFWFRVLLAAWVSATIVIFWKLVKLLFSKNKRVEIISTIVFALLTTLPLLEGQIVNAELFTIGLITLGFYLLLQKTTTFTLIAVGALFSLATLFKVPAAFDIAAIVFLWLILLSKKQLKPSQFAKNIFFLSIGFLTPILLTIFWYLSRGALDDYIKSAFLENVGYLSSWRPDDVQKSFLIKNAPVIFRGLITLSGLIIIFFFRHKLSKRFMFVTAWLLFSLFAVTLSERPYPHYLIQAVPAFSILLAMLIAEKSLEQVLVIIPLFLALLVPVYYRFWYYPSFPYYERFLKFSLGQLTKEEYFNRFNSNVTRNYKIAEFIIASTRKDEPIFVWGDSSPIYALSRRLPPFKYVANYHISDFSSKSDVLKMLNDKKPSFVVVLPDSQEFPELIFYLDTNYVAVSSIDEALVWKKINNSKH